MNVRREGFNVFKEVVMTAAQVMGYRVCKDRMRGAVEEKKKAHKKMLQRNVSEVRGEGANTRNGKRK